MTEKEKTRMFDRVSGNRWLPGVAAVVVLMGAFALGGVVWALSSSSQAAEGQAPVLSIRMQIPDSTAPEGHSGWIELQSLQWEISLPITESLPSGSPVATQLTVTKAVDQASAKLLEACTKGEHLPEVKIEMLRVGGASRPYVEYTLQNALITSYSIAGSSQDSMPTESISFIFEKMDTKYLGGDTITHECGHWLGLYHSYEGTCTSGRGGRP